MCKYNTVPNLVIFLLLINTSSSCDDGECDSRTNERILGGVMSERNSRPFQVALYLRVGAMGDIGFCGGSLIHQQWVLTAAHCCFHGNDAVTYGQVYMITIHCGSLSCSPRHNVEILTTDSQTYILVGISQKLPSSGYRTQLMLKAILGAHSLYDRYENGRRMVNVEEIIVHPNWDPSTFANDLALLKLANVIQTSETIGIVRLPYLNSVSSNFAGFGATVSGWGTASGEVTFISPTLREKFMTVMTDPLCNTIFSNNLPPNFICGFSSYSGTCKGDNGGPMTIFSNLTRETILVGVASFVAASGCNNALPSVFTRVQHHLNWIGDTTGIILD